MKLPQVCIIMNKISDLSETALLKLPNNITDIRKKELIPKVTPTVGFKNGIYFENSFVAEFTLGNISRKGGSF